ncbi:TPA: hypothetical protein HA251_02760 [Candidatus Woesearchaeota archaeon]|nr:hypothetical protein [Candidatus Woesearchaeota archaeon]
MNPTIGIDAIPLALVHPESPFKSISEFKKSQSTDISELKGFFGALAIGVEVSDYDNFKISFFESLKKAFEDTGYQASKEYFESPLCSKDLRQFTEGEQYIHEAFIKHIKQHIKDVHIVYSAFNPWRIPEVTILGRTRTPEKVHPKILAIEHLNNSFPHICTWKLLNVIRTNKCKVLIDHFGAKRTKAWEEIESSSIPLEVVFKGDECDPLIATADILLRYLTDRIERNKDGYDTDGIVKNLKELVAENKIVIYKINNQDYPYITPRDNRNIPLRKYLRRPVFFVLPPDSKHVDFSFFVSQSSGRKFLSHIYRQNACYKKFDQNQDRSIIKDGDYIVFLDDAGKQTADLIQISSGDSINIIKYTDIIKHYSKGL